jgi:hypothetical protein
MVNNIGFQSKTSGFDVPNVWSCEIAMNALIVLNVNQRTFFEMWCCIDISVLVHVHWLIPLSQVAIFPVKG